MGIIVVLGFLVCSFSLQKGLERITKWMMVALLVIMVVLAINSVCTAGGSQGLRFYLVPDLARMKKVGIGNESPPDPARRCPDPKAGTWRAH